ncbi:MAG: hypothetical protein IKQ24_10805 [Verrucomicrobia bacterium]|nr:hypothetical protein [Verrucomicrobiota bacterium]
MNTGKIILTMSIIGLTTVSVLVAQSLGHRATQKDEKLILERDQDLRAKGKMLFEKGSLRVSANSSESNHLYQIFMGDSYFPYFEADVLNADETEQIKILDIKVNIDTSVSLVKKNTKEVSYALTFFSEDEDQKIFILFDLNMDGQWDVRVNPTRSENRSLIYLDGEWLSVDKKENLLSDLPLAWKNDTRYEFRNGKWSETKTSTPISAE